MTAITKEIRETLSRAGIGRRYHERSFNDDDPHEAQIKAMILDGTLAERMARGEGLTVFGYANATYDLFMVTARALMLTGKTVRVTSPVRLAEAMEDRHYEEITRCEEVPVLFLTNFTKRGECPFSPWQKRRIERILDDRLDALRPTCLHNGAIEGGQVWWSDDTLKRLQCNLTVDVF